VAAAGADGDASAAVGIAIAIRGTSSKDIHRRRIADLLRGNVVAPR
jgi:hypothetical protein